MLIGSRAREINLLLEAIERHSAYYNMKLNKGKCNYIAMNGNADIHFADGTKLGKVDKVTYLGGILNKDANRADEVNNRISNALTTCSKLKEFFKKSSCPTKWKFSSLQRGYNLAVNVRPKHASTFACNAKKDGCIPNVWT